MYVIALIRRLPRIRRQPLHVPSVAPVIFSHGRHNAENFRLYYPIAKLRSTFRGLASELENFSRLFALHLSPRTGKISGTVLTRV